MTDRSVAGCRGVSGRVARSGAGPGQLTRAVVTEGDVRGVAPGTLCAIPTSAKDTNLNVRPMSDEPRTGPRTAAVIPAAGRGVRLGPGIPKALRTLGGTPMLVHAVRAMARARAVSLVVVVAPPEETSGVRHLLDGHPLPAAAATEVVVVSGAGTRQRSVSRGIAALPGDVEVVLVHDAARPLVPVEMTDSVVEAVRAGAPAVVPALPVPDTVKEVEPQPNGDPEPVVGTPDRVRLRAVQTPQGFGRRTLDEAHERIACRGGGATDDAGMVERLGHPVVVVPGHPEAFKVTRPLDLVLAEAVLARRRATDGF
jgi:2-C-methyl-D-erythritol 4-phosphate cytidylyltransferase